MKKRVFVGGLHHESDTFNPIITGRDVLGHQGSGLVH